MAFVLEKISEEDRKKYNIDRYKDRWSIDREKESYLINVGGVGRSTYTNFVLFFDGKYIEILTDRNFTNPSINEVDTTFNVDLITIPYSMKSKMEEIKGAIIEALNSYGYFGNREALGKVIVNLPQDSKIVLKNGE